MQTLRGTEIKGDNVTSSPISIVSSEHVILYVWVYIYVWNTVSMTIVVERKPPKQVLVYGSFIVLTQRQSTLRSRVHESV